ncbi:hypothetical protein AK88_04153 [Plasmodium fragile]|uniref:GYF domain-containing protein n=1 Tax=Plasmodium fragile TaxID=5857 RepID=A0A0D9QHC2_PLAFR|nr:uncharacterized protein AK88_04153 [Plasmodium fragile]KJP86182.1 hypothetical protein AK88_04153 [Plasmodium fragile]
MNELLIRSKSGIKLYTFERNENNEYTGKVTFEYDGCIPDAIWSCDGNSFLILHSVEGLLLISNYSDRDNIRVNKITCHNRYKELFTDDNVKLIKHVQWSPANKFVVFFFPFEEKNFVSIGNLLLFSVQHNKVLCSFKIRKKICSNWPIIHFTTEDRYFFLEKKSNLYVYDTHQLIQTNTEVLHNFVNTDIPTNYLFTWHHPNVIAMYMSPYVGEDDARFFIVHTKNNFLGDVYVYKIQGLSSCSLNHVDGVHSGKKKSPPEKNVSLDLLIQKSFGNLDNLYCMWSLSGKHVILMVYTNDTTNKSYGYVSNCYYFSLSARHMGMKKINEQVAQDVKWNQTSDDFLLIEGKSDNSIFLYDHNLNIKLKISSQYKNTIKWCPFGNMIALGGFGNLAGDICFYFKEKDDSVILIKQYREPCTVLCDWSADGTLFMTASTYPRMKVENTFKIYTYEGKLVNSYNFNELYDVQWKKAPPGVLSEPPKPQANLKDNKRSVYKIKYMNVDAAVGSGAGNAIGGSVLSGLISPPGAAPISVNNISSGNASDAMDEATFKKTKGGAEAGDKDKAKMGKAVVAPPVPSPNNAQAAAATLGRKKKPEKGGNAYDWDVDWRNKTASGTAVAAPCAPSSVSAASAAAVGLVVPPTGTAGISGASSVSNVGSMASIGSLGNVSLGKVPEEKHDQGVTPNMEKKNVEVCAVNGSTGDSLLRRDNVVGGMVEGPKEDYCAQGIPSPDSANGADAPATDDKKKQKKKKKEKEKDNTVKLQSDASKSSVTTKQVAVNSWANAHPSQNVQDGTSLLYHMGRSNVQVGIPPHAFPPNSFAVNGGPPGDWNEPERQTKKGEPTEGAQMDMGKGNEQDKLLAEASPNNEKEPDQDKKRKKEKINKKKKSDASGAGNENGVVGESAPAGKDKVVMQPVASTAATTTTTQVVPPPENAKSEPQSTNKITSFLSKIMKYKADVSGKQDRVPQELAPPNDRGISDGGTNERDETTARAAPVVLSGTGAQNVVDTQDSPSRNSNGLPMVGHDKDGSNTHHQRKNDTLHSDMNGPPKSGANKNIAESSSLYQPHINPLPNGVPMQSGNSSFPLFNQLSVVKQRIMQGSSHHPQGADGPAPSGKNLNGDMYFNALQQQSYNDVTKGSAHQSSHLLYMSNQQGKSFYSSTLPERRDSSEGPINDASSIQVNPSNEANEQTRPTIRNPPEAKKSNEDLLRLFKRVLPHATVNIVGKNQHTSNSISDPMLNASSGHTLSSTQNLDPSAPPPRRNLIEEQYQMGFKREHIEDIPMTSSNEHIGRDEGNNTHCGISSSSNSSSSVFYPQRAKEIHKKDLATAMIMRMKQKEEQQNDNNRLMIMMKKKQMVPSTGRENSIPANIKSHLSNLDLCELLKCYHSLNVQLIQLKLYWIMHKIQAYDSTGSGGTHAKELMAKDKKIVAKVKEMKMLLDYANDLVKETLEKNRKKYESLIQQFTVILKQHDNLYQQKKEKMMRDHADKEAIVQFICNIDKIVHRYVTTNGQHEEEEKKKKKDLPVSASPSLTTSGQHLGIVDGKGEQGQSSTMPLNSAAEYTSGFTSDYAGGSYLGGYPASYSNIMRKTGPPPMEMQHKLLMQKLSDPGRRTDGNYNQQNLNQNKISLSEYQRNYFLNTIGGHNKDEQAKMFLKRSGGNNEPGVTSSLDITYAEEQEDKKNNPVGRAGGYEAISRGSMYSRGAQSLEVFPRDGLSLDGHTSHNDLTNRNINGACTSPLLNRINKSLMNKSSKEDGAQDRDSIKDMSGKYSLLELLRKKKQLEMQGGVQSGIQSGLLSSLRAGAQGRDDHLDANSMLRKANQSSTPQGGKYTAQEQDITHRIKSMMHAGAKEQHHHSHQGQHQQMATTSPSPDHLNYYYQNAQADQSTFTSQAKHEAKALNHCDRVKTQIDMVMTPMREPMKQDTHTSKQHQQYAPPKEYMHFSDYNSFVKSANMYPSGLRINSKEDVSPKGSDQTNGGVAVGTAAGAARAIGGALNDQRTAGRGDIHLNYMSNERNKSEDHHSMMHPNAAHPSHVLPTAQPAQPAQMVCKIPSIYKTSSTNKSMNSSGEKKNATYNLLEMEETKRPDALRDKCWQYVDPKGVVQGPFFLDEMRIWSEMGYFEPMLPVRCCDSDRFVALNKLFPPPHKPFTIIPKPQPILQWDEEL